MDKENKYLEALLTKNLDGDELNMKWYMQASAKSKPFSNCPQCQEPGTSKYRNMWSPLQCSKGHVWWKGTGEMHKEEDGCARWSKNLDAEAVAYYDSLHRKQIAENIERASEALKALSSGSRQTRSNRSFA